ncbi:hypothetical protein HOY81_19125 [Streptomyces sp. JJ36]|nr:hypothetical protein [Streptomyces sp. JJ36]
MGSELRDTGTGEVLWGLSSASWVRRAWLRPGGLHGLRMTEEERAGRTGRVRATGLLRSSVWTPYLHGFEPYARLVEEIRDCVADPAAVRPFPYDWRLPTAVNGRLLAAAAREHLEAWRRHPAHDRARRARADERPARLVFVAHSMGGLVARAALDPAHDAGLAGDTRAVLTLGTPFFGAAKAAAILNTGRGGPVPLPHRQLREVCAGMPGLHDLLPQYRCVRDGDDVRRLEPGDVAALGGSAELAAAAEAAHRDRERVPLPGHRAVVGTTQPTVQNLTLRDGVVVTHHSGVRQHSDGRLLRDTRGRLRWFDLQGDGTVYKQSAAQGPAVIPLPFQHGAVARHPVARKAVAELLRDDDPLGPPQGAAGCGLDVPDLAVAGERLTVRIGEVDTLSGLDCRAVHLETGTVLPLRPGWRDGTLVATPVLGTPGLHRITAATPDGHTVSQLTLCVPAETPES